jgi:hypothetical protein
MLHENNINQLFILDELKNVKEVTTETIKNYDGFEQMTEEESSVLLSTLETYCEVLLNQIQRELI